MRRASWDRAGRRPATPEPEGGTDGALLGEVRVTAGDSQATRGRVREGASGAVLDCNDGSRPHRRPGPVTLATILMMFLCSVSIVVEVSTTLPGTSNDRVGALDERAGSHELLEAADLEADVRVVLRDGATRARGVQPRLPRDELV